MEHSRRDFLKTAALGSAGTFMLLNAGFGKTVLAQDDDLSILSGWLRYRGKGNALYNHFYAIASSYLSEREKTVSRLKTPEQWKSRQQAMKRKVTQAIGGEFPDKSPLKAETTGYLQRRNFTVEKVIFESMPDYHVTGCLFLPKSGEAKKPAVIYCSGHTEIAFRAETYQHVILNLVNKGFVVFALDPVGQGERLQYYNPRLGSSMIGGATKEHSYPGAQCFLSGSSIARYFIWDGIRTVDYLLTRPEVDSGRIGITGRSGGGTQSAYIGAMDQRIQASAPECYITSFQRLLQSIGPQDAEQNLFEGLKNGIDHADLLELRIPKPTMMITTTRDFFSIQGARETSREVERVYKIFGKSNNFSMIEDDAPHASTVRNRERMYAFFQHQFNNPGSSQDESVEYFSPDELHVTKTGQVLTSRKGKSVFHLNRQRAGKQISALEKRRESTVNNPKSRIPEIKKLSGFVDPQTNSKPVFAGRYVREGYQIEKYFTEGPEKYKIPYLLFLPKVKEERYAAMFYLHPGGKATEAYEGGEIETLLKKGYAVLAPDLAGTGELGPGGFGGDAYEFKIGRGAYNIWFFGMQVGKSIVATQVADLLRLIQVLKNRDDIDNNHISAIARGSLTSTLLHAAAFSEDISKVALIEPLLSYKSIVMNKYYQPELIHQTVPGSTHAYDLPDVAACLAPRKLWLIRVLDHRMKEATDEQIAKTYNYVRKAYQAAQNNFVIKPWNRYQAFSGVLDGWL
jgi:cephalosporin-C deacetylase-like acetyl esterase